jgi:transposase-like protein
MREVQKSLDSGQSKRSIARRLGWDEGTIRRDALKLTLAAEQLESIERGAAAEPFLRALAEARHQRGVDKGREEHKALTDRRLREDALDKRHSSKLAEELLKILDEHDLCASDEEEMIIFVEQMSWRRGDGTDRPCLDPSTARSKTKPSEYRAEMHDRLNYFISWLLAYSFCRAPELVIRDSAIVEVRKTVQSSNRRRVRGRK